MFRNPADDSSFRASRRRLLFGAGALLAMNGLLTLFPRSAAAAPITLPPLPWAENGLAPVISAQTISFHYGKHHKGYVENLNKLVAGTPLADLPLEAIVKESFAQSKMAIFNNAAQAWNHSFYWQSLKPNGGASRQPHCVTR
jgi:Fe-Mn family superoxide dismutase